MENMENFIKTFEEFHELNELRLTLNKYKKLVKKEVDKETFDDQLFYDHMVACFNDGNSPIDCASLWDAGNIKEQN
jgi:hypothetical protein